MQLLCTVYWLCKFDVGDGENSNESKKQEINKNVKRKKIIYSKKFGINLLTECINQFC